MFFDFTDNRKHKHIGSGIVEVYPDFAFVPLYPKYSQMMSNPYLRQAPAVDYLKKFLPDDYLMYRNFVFSLIMDEEFQKSILMHENEPKTDTWCVEIKPKQGWIAPSDAKSGMCIFCMNQFYKVRNAFSFQGQELRCRHFQSTR